MSIKSSQTIQYWWVTASENNPEHSWHWRNFFEYRDNPKQGHNWGGRDWIRSPVSHARIRDMRKGDIVVAYQAGKGVVGLVYLDRDGYQEVKGGNYDMLDMKASPVVWLDEPVPYSEIRNLPSAKEHFEFVRAKQGTVFRISPVGFNKILDLISKKNPHQRNEIYDFLSAKPSAFAAEVVAVDETGGLKPPRKATFTIQRVIRDSAVGRSLKQLYQYQCQVCGMTIELPNNRYYAEIHHLRPVGKPHNGKDGTPNTIVVCPHHHAMFDLGAIAIDPNTQTVKHWNPDGTENDSSLILKHRLDKASLNYHYWKLFKGARK